MTHTPESREFEHLLDLPNVIAVDYDHETDTVNVWVSEKLPLERLELSDVVASNVDPGYETDVHDAGMSEGDPGLTPEVLDHPDNDIFHPEADRHARHRPVPSGVSEINARSTAATAGHYPAVVTDPSAGASVWEASVQEGDIVRISNCHVYARSGVADLGEPVIQPSPYDGGDTASDTTGRLLGFLPLEEGVRADVAARTVDPDETDAETIAPHDLPPEWPTGIRREPPQKGETLTKTGRTTGVTSGNVIATGAAVRVSYPHSVVTLYGQILTSDMSAGGDSGSPVYDEAGQLIGLLYAGSPEITAHNPIHAVEDDFGIQLMSEEPAPEPEPEPEPVEDGTGDGDENGSDGQESDRGIVVGDPKDPSWVFDARLVRVVDGDTYDLQFDLGFYTHRIARVRLADYNTAEIYGTKAGSPEHELGQKQSQFVRDWFAEAEAEAGPDTEWPFVVRTKKQTGKYGRYIGHVVRVFDEESLTDALRREFGDDS